MSDRRQPRSTRAALAPLAPLVALWSVGAVVLVLAIAQDAIPRQELLLDPATVLGGPWYTGLVSNLGILGWAVASTAGAAGGWVSRLAGRHRAAEVLTGGALLTTLLLLDDLLQLHIVVTRALGMGKASFYLAYAGLAAWWAVVGYRELRRTRWPLLLAATVALSGSAVVDQFGPAGTMGLAIEDSFKFLGILAWAQYFVLTGTDIASSAVAIQGADGLSSAGHGGDNAAMGATGGTLAAGEGAFAAGGRRTAERQ